MLWDVNASGTLTVADKGIVNTEVTKALRRPHMRTSRSIFVGACLCLWAAAAFAATINVTTTSDVIDANDGLCSLREAIIAANTKTPSGLIAGECPGDNAANTLNLPAGTYTLSIVAAGANDATTGDLNITASVDIVGIGHPIVQGGVGWADGIFDIASGTAVTLSGFTITGGNRNISSGVDGGGGIRNAGTLMLIAMTVRDNATTHSGTGLAPGGGIFASSEGSVSIVDSTISGNTTQDSGGGIYTQGSLWIAGSTISGNQAIGASFSYVGGVDFFYNGAPPGTLSITNSTIANNTGNTGLGAAGLYIEGNAAFVGTLRNITITGNSNPQGGGLALFGALANITLIDTLIAANSGAAPDCAAANFSTITSGGNNLIGNDTGCTISSPQASDQIGTAGAPIDARLGVLADNGGPTATVALLTSGPASPAIDAGANATCSGSDQRRVARPQGAACDIGAFEVSSAVSPTLSSVASRKVHGAAGTFDLPLGSSPTNPSTEPRQGPSHLIVFVFDKQVTSGTAQVTEGSGTAGVPTFFGSEMRVPLTGVANQQYLTLTVSSVSSADGGIDGGGSVRVGFLLGDVTQNRVVTVADLGQVNAQIAQLVSDSNFLKDVNASGTLSVADKGITNTQITKALPAP